MVASVQYIFAYSVSVAYCSYRTTSGVVSRFVKASLFVCDPICKVFAIDDEGLRLSVEFGREPLFKVCF